MISRWNSSKRSCPTIQRRTRTRSSRLCFRHEGPWRSGSGFRDPYFSHPLEVADPATISWTRLDHHGSAARHHRRYPGDVARYCRPFGEEVWRLVDGVTKLTRIELQSDASRQAENFRKLVLAMSEDIPVFLQFADWLHNMRTIDHLKPEKRRIAMKPWKSTRSWPSVSACRRSRANWRIVPFRC